MITVGRIGNTFAEYTIVDTLMDTIVDVVAEDVDEDGRIDIVAALGNANKVSWFRNIDDDNLRLNPENNKPDNPYLLDSYPNPFNAVTTISFSLPYSGNTILEVYNLMGQQVEKLIGDWMEA
jgi:hypothetical protein